MNGIIFPESESRGKTRPSLSERMKVLVEKQKKRILVFRNEDSLEGKEIVANRFDEVRVYNPICLRNFSFYDSCFFKKSSTYITNVFMQCYMGF